ncbi:MAG: hypothetical protein E7432_07445 [Ruminococcaceae bacterium]|nr:hypothetical protein [Oscillospiraceae bacterium]
MRKYIALISVLICIFSLAGCTELNQQDLSFLNYENLAAVTEEYDTLSVFKSDEEKTEYTIKGEQLAKFLDTADWKAQNKFIPKVRHNTEHNSKAFVQIIIDNIYLKIFDTDTANVYDESVGKEIYYQMSDGDYGRFIDMID